MKKKNFFFRIFFCQELYVNAVTLGEMLQIWPHSCSKTNSYFGTESDIVLEQRDSWQLQQRRRGRKRAQTGLRLSCLTTETSHAKMSCILSFWFGFFPWKRRVDFFTESDLNSWLDNFAVRLCYHHRTWHSKEARKGKDWGRRKDSLKDFLNKIELIINRNNVMVRKL